MHHGFVTTRSTAFQVLCLVFFFFFFSSILHDLRVMRRYGPS